MHPIGVTSASSVYPAGDAVAAVRECSVAGERVRLVETGADPRARAIVMLHGWGASAYNFRAVLPLLARAGYRVIVPDLRGHGWSEKPVSPGSYSPRALSAWTHSLLEALDVERCVLVGQSIGGAIAMDTAAEFPDRVGAAVLLAPIGFTPVRRVAIARMLGVSRWRPAAPPRWVIESVLRRIYGVRGRWTPRDVDEYWVPLQQADAVSALLRIVDEFDFTPRVPGPLSTFGSRLVIRFGERDRLIPWRDAVRHAAGFAAADVAVIRGAGHVPAEEVPGEVTTAILGAAKLVWFG